MTDSINETSREISERLTRLETSTELKFNELEKALVLARDLVKGERDQTREALEYRLKGMNQFQKRMDKLEGTFATKEDVSRNTKLIYVGVGILLALQFFFNYT